MKSPSSLQERLLSVLPSTKPPLRLAANPKRPWSDLDLDEVAWVVQDYVNQNPEVIEDDNRLKDWLDSYKFHRATRK